MTKEETEINGEPIFQLLRFNPRRAMRGAPAAEVRIMDEDNSLMFWMSEKNIKDNIEQFGEHPGLLAALQAYKDRKEFPARES